MPTPDSHLELDDVEKATLVRWIEQGAEWKPHWAFIPPTKPAVPPVRPRRLGTHPDRPLRAAPTLRGDGLDAVARGAARDLIRRVSIDLTGLPPTLAEIDAFLADRVADAYEKVVDRLLASPAYGERMAADWLDIARYADSHGYQDDGMREMSPWRDWVIARVQPQHAASTSSSPGSWPAICCPTPTHEQRLATAFNRNHMQSQEGGIVAEEYRVEYVADRVNTLGRAFLGLTRRVRALPRPQVRPDPAEGLLPALRASSTTSTRPARSRTRACRVRR